jgi:hypothetical protein
VRDPDEAKRVIEAIARDSRREPPPVGDSRGNPSDRAVSCAAEPAAGKAGLVESRHKIGTSPHQVPDEACAEIFDHQDEGLLVDAEVERRNP